MPETVRGDPGYPCRGAGARPRLPQLPAAGFAVPVGLAPAIEKYPPRAARDARQSRYGGGGQHDYPRGPGLGLVRFQADARAAKVNLRPIQRQHLAHPHSGAQAERP
jgi:hypothetical protein